MLKLFELASETLASGERCVLCTVVRLQGSGYGRVGARLLVTESGSRAGYISGGCLERDVCRRALYEAHSRPKLMTFDTRGNAAAPSRYNLGCEGLVTVLCQPLFSDSCMVQVAAAIVQQRRTARLLTVYRSEWDAVPAGSIVAQFNDGTVKVSSTLKDLTMVRPFKRLMCEQTGSFTASVAVARHGALECVVETLQPSRRLVIFGAGDDVQPVVHLAVGLGWEVCVVGRNPELATRHRFPGAQVYLGDFADMAKAVAMDECTHVLSMSHDFVNDLQLLPRLLSAPVRSIGLLGSKRRLAKLLAELYYRGERLTSEQIDRIRSPLGLDLGAESPADIALSIISELLAIENGKTGTRLSDKVGTVHLPLPHHTLSLDLADGRVEDAAQLSLGHAGSFPSIQSVEGH